MAIFRKNKATRWNNLEKWGARKIPFQAAARRSRNLQNLLDKTSIKPPSALSPIQYSTEVRLENPMATSVHVRVNGRIHKNCPRLEEKSAAGVKQQFTEKFSRGCSWPAPRVQEIKNMPAVKVTAQTCFGGINVSRQERWKHNKERQESPKTPELKNQRPLLMSLSKFLVQVLFKNIWCKCISTRNWITQRASSSTVESWRRNTHKQTEKRSLNATQNRSHPSKSSVLG